ncbi:antibiotic ABC transporter permease [Actinoplanes sp. SE50]|uniref:ABC transporter permease n=1 Tax=unclassified Actinoplanes TaxID=2626549 RepID=UPI00023EC291|nr:MULTISPECIES: ABC-2 family transporter protein [unclassified Actinoplanes]AEV84110.1 antibiotic transport system permease protein [Actinoplanes sp. SE50/110]ATO82502.1 antibiotic ABC transporter permease [Actinoplanes sp. SE50]SLL99909.1 antibiotic ABC transporter permease [Actinoplanes sp. SE50/110]
MRAYRALARATARSALAYKNNLFLGLGAVFVQFIAMLAVWRVVLADGSAVQGFGWPQMRAYLLVAFAAGTLVSVFGDFRTAARIQSGLVALDIIKPVDFQRARLAETLGGTWLEALVVVVVGGVTLALTGGVPTPPGAALALFAASMLMLVPLKFLIVYVSTLACFWTQNFIGVQWARIALVNLLSGALIPLAFLPGWLAAVAQWSPFAGLVSTPALIFVGQVGVGRGLALVAAQLGWVVALWFGARLIWRAALRQLTVHGG